MAHIRLSRAGRKASIIAVMTASRHKAHTVNSLARSLDIAPSTYLRQILGDMIYDRELAFWCDRADDGSVLKRYYTLPDGKPSRKTLSAIKNWPF